MQEVVSTLLTSKHFYDKDDANPADEIIGGMLKSPLDLVAQTLSFIDYEVPDAIAEGESHYKLFYYNQITKKVFIPSGQELFRPPSVAGFPANYEAPDYDLFWFNTATIISRFDLPNLLLDKKRTTVDFSVANFVKINVDNPADADSLIAELTALLFPEIANAARHDFFLNDILLDGGAMTKEMWEDEWWAFENEQSNGVEDALIPLFKALFWSQEYQNN